ncbi:MAG: DUF4013 domain-containing protein [Bacteroidetes bacterium]|nr:DUF4013 domain-containing protein [Bacteroidota bacterium]
MQLYQKRDFGALINDTFTFFKENGKNYFKNFILLNGLLVILLVGLYIVGYKNFFSQLIDSNLEGNSFYFEEYFQENMVFFIAFFIAFLVIFFIMMMMIYTFPVLYLKRYGVSADKNIKLNDIITDMKDNFGRFILFCLGLVFIILPLMGLLFGLSVVLIFLIIGIFLMLFIVPWMSNVMSFTLYDYFNRKDGFFSSLGYAIRSQFSYSKAGNPSPFWKYWGSTAVILFIIQVVSGIFSLIPVFIMTGSMLTVPEENNQDSMKNFMEGTMGIIYFASYGISILVSLLLSNFVYVNSGLMYYDSRLDLHQKEDLLEIDTIGNREV